MTIKISLKLNTKVAILIVSPFGDFLDEENRNVR